MHSNTKEMLTTYFRQQEEMSIPDYIFQQPMSNNEKPEQKEILAEKKQSVIVAIEKKPEKTYEAKRAALIELYYEIQNCSGCSLKDTRNKLVFGAGNAGASVMVIGEAPGFEENLQGKPFVGKAGELLTKMVSAINLDRDKDLFITNILKCRPPENRNPNQTESLSCVPILKRQISIIEPKVLLILGRIAAQELLQLTDSIAKLRMKLHTYNSIPAIVTYHPAALLRNQNYKKPAWEDLQKLQNLLKENGAYVKDR